jgi:pyruvate/2-oxoacid:ferredoxin oxidoreductase beta subunit
MSEEHIETGELTKLDFKVPNPVKWCAGCGGHAVLNTVQAALPETGVKKENIVFVSGTSIPTGSTDCTGERLRLHRASKLPTRT